MAYRRPAAFLLGMEGLALHRAFAGEFDAAFVAARLAEVRAILAADERGSLGTGDHVGETDTVAGYRIWARTYDEPGNPLIGVEEPVVRDLLAGLPPGRAVDAACGTGRHAAALAAAGHAVVGVDSSPDMLAVARRNVPGALPGRHCVHGGRFRRRGAASGEPVPRRRLRHRRCRRGVRGAGLPRAALAAQRTRGRAVPAGVGGRGGRRRVREHTGRDRLAFSAVDSVYAILVDTVYG
jgi:SAM-dependent methyltransferase